MKLNLVKKITIPISHLNKAAQWYGYEENVIPGPKGFKKERVFV